MKIGILGSGAVGQALAEGFINEGHQVWIATRDLDADKVGALQEQLTNATVCGFEDAAKEGELLVLCVKWAGAHEMIELAGPQNMASKVVIDTNNLITQEDDVIVYTAPATSGGEEVQSWLPDSHVVKAFNTVGAAMMYQPDFNGMIPTMFIAGDNTDAKQQVSDICSTFGWEALDAGGIIASRSLEPLALLWINNSMASGSSHHAFKML